MNDFYFFETQFLAERGRWGVYGIIHASYEFLNRHASEWEVAYYALGTLGHGDFAMRRVPWRSLKNLGGGASET